MWNHLDSRSNVQVFNISFCLTFDTLMDCINELPRIWIASHLILASGPLPPGFLRITDFLTSLLHACMTFTVRSAQSNLHFTTCAVSASNLVEPLHCAENIPCAYNIALLLGRTASLSYRYFVWFLSGTLFRDHFTFIPL